MYIVTFTAHQQRNMVRTPHFFGAGDATDIQDSVHPVYPIYTSYVGSAAVVWLSRHEQHDVIGMET